jgi:hypothetical protein
MRGVGATDRYTVVTVPPDAPRQDETLGTKFKFWYFDEDDRKILFKRGRDNEDWSEKVAAQIAQLFALPVADVELAELEGTRGIVSPSFLTPSEQLFHGNELLMGLSEDYPQLERYHVGQHTLEAVFGALENVHAEPTPGFVHPASSWNAADQMIGYLLLDAVVGNTDRHHENWAIYTSGPRRILAPSYDHASSLGRNEPFERVQLRLSGRDHRVTVETYAAKARSAFYASPSAKRPLTTMDAFEKAAEVRPIAAQLWFERLASVEPQIRGIFEAIPDERISPPHRELAARIVATNIERLRGVVSMLL